MTEHDSEEETYSLIFKSLRHPIRRKILRLLESGQMTFSEILKEVGIDNGHLSYHLDELSLLLVKNADGTYSLSSIGSASVKLMNGVEEEASADERYIRRIRPLRNVAILSTTLLILLLLPVIAYSIGYITTEVRTETHGNVSIPAGESFSYKVTIAYGETISNHASNDGLLVTVRPPISGLTSWEKDVVIYGLHVESGSHIKVRTIFSSGTYDEEDISSDSRYGTGEYWMYMDGAGSTTIEVDTISSIESSSGTLQPRYRRESISRPFFLYGVTSILVCIVCLMGLYLTWRKMDV